MCKKAVLIVLTVSNKLQLTVTEVPNECFTHQQQCSFLLCWTYKPSFPDYKQILFLGHSLLSSIDNKNSVMMHSDLSHSSVHVTVWEDNEGWFASQLQRTLLKIADSTTTHIINKTRKRLRIFKLDKLHSKAIILISCPCDMSKTV